MKTVQPMTGAHEVTVAANQPEYDPLVCALYWDEDMKTPVVLSRWKPSDEERERIAAGEDLYLAVLTFGEPLQPLCLQVGPEGWNRGDGDPILPDEIGGNNLPPAGDCQ